MSSVGGVVMCGARVRSGDSAAMLLRKSCANVHTTCYGWSHTGPVAGGCRNTLCCFQKGGIEVLIKRKEKVISVYNIMGAQYLLTSMHIHVLLRYGNLLPMLLLA